MKCVKAIFLSLCCAMWLEFFYKFGATYDPHNFTGAAIIYSLYLSIIYLFINKLNLQQKYFTCLLIYGFIGLMAEWFLIGNAPWSSTNALQIPMFIFHATYPFIGINMLGITRYKKAAKSVFKTFTLFTIICLLGFLIESPDWKFAFFIWIPLIPYIAAFIIIFYYSYRSQKQI